MTKRKDPADCKPGGQPTKYRPAMCGKIDAYIADCVEVEEGKERRLPTRAGVAIKLKLSLATIDTYEKKYSEFLGALNRVRVYQQEELINRSFNGSGNSNIGKMLLSANHGMVERKDVNVSGDLNITLVDYGNA